MFSCYCDLEGCITKLWPKPGAFFLKALILINYYTVFFIKALAILPSMAFYTWGLICRHHLCVFTPLCKLIETNIKNTKNLVFFKYFIQ